MKTLLAVLCLAWLSLCCLTTQAQMKRTFPKEFKKIHFGMSMEDLANVRKNMDTQSLTRNSFRYIWTQNIKKHKFISTAIFYFDDAGEHPFYELILVCHDLTQRDKWIDKYLGSPNDSNNTEWRYPSDQGFDIRAWRYEDRLILVGLVPGTEWDEQK